LAKVVEPSASATAGPAVRVAPQSAVEREPQRFRPDIEGLRAVAVVLVMLYHAGLPFVPGGFVGVDVFFVISGFLITTQLVTEAERGTLSLQRFYARRAKRLLPAAAVVLAATAALTYFFVPLTRWRDIGGDVVASAVYLVNWRLADRSVDYLAEGSAPSPVQHFWSLAVEEQFYLLWPLLILAGILLASGAQTRMRGMVSVLLGFVVVASFGWSLLQTEAAPARAFFETTTRIWELGVGAGLALAAGACSRLPRTPALVLGWAGLGAIGLSGVLFSTGTPFPGYAAALPVLGAAAVITAGFPVAAGGSASLLGKEPFRWLGRLSYSLYLWHWPLLVVATARWGALSPLTGLAIAVASVVPAWLTFRLVENPFRYSALVARSPRLTLSLGANFSLAGVAAGLALLALVTSVSATNPGAGAPALGGAVLREDPRNDPAGAPVDSVEWMTPTPAQATSDLPQAQRDGCQQRADDPAVLSCEYGDQDGQISVAAVGDSKMMQWMAALGPLAEQNGWRLTTYLKASCSFAKVMTEYESRPYQECRIWGESVLGELMSDPPDYVITSQGGGRGLDEHGEPSRDAMVRGLQAMWTVLTSAGIQVIVLGDNPPPPGLSVYECVQENLDQLSACAFDRRLGTAEVQREATDGMEGVEFVDLTYAICPTDRCAPVIGNVLVYRQGSHITATYIATLTPRLERALSDAGLPAG
jgi:peptidoglycan/LPS O-acetylase OafA/YrhL